MLIKGLSILVMQLYLFIVFMWECHVGTDVCNFHPSIDPNLKEEL